MVIAEMVKVRMTCVALRSGRTATRRQGIRIWDVVSG
jgi:hypothetical protein